MSLTHTLLRSAAWQGQKTPTQSLGALQQNHAVIDTPMSLRVTAKAVWQVYAQVAATGSKTGPTSFAQSPCELQKSRAVHFKHKPRRVAAKAVWQEFLSTSRCNLQQGRGGTSRKVSASGNKAVP